MKEHWSVDSDAPTETVDGEPIEYVWLVMREHTGREDEVLGVHTTEESARNHGKRADISGETVLRQSRLVTDGDGVAPPECEVVDL